MELKADTPLSQNDYDKNVEKFHSEYVQLPEESEEADCQKASSEVGPQCSDLRPQNNFESESATCCCLTAPWLNPFSCFSKKHNNRRTGTKIDEKISQL